MSRGGVFGTTEVCRLTGASYRQLNYWEQLGYIHPSIQRAAGTGFSHAYSEEDVRLIKLAVKLLRIGFRVSAIWENGPDALDALLRHEVGSVHV